MKKIQTVVITSAVLALSTPLMADSGFAENYPMMGHMGNPNMYSMMQRQGGPMMNPQNMQQRIGNPSAGGGHYINPQFMHQMMSYKQNHMSRMEALLSSIDSSLKELVEQGKKP